MSSATLQTQMDYCKQLAGSALVPDAYRNRPENLLVALGYAEALGLAPMVAIQQINVIKGKPTMSAQLMASLARRAGHKLRISKVDGGVWAQLVRRDDPDHIFRAYWDMARAKSAGLTGKGGQWANDPMTMLKWRAVSEVVREACPEVLAGAYTAEEMDWEAADTSGQPPRVDVSHLVPDAQPVTTEVADPDTGEIIPVEDTVDAEVIDDEVLR